MTCKFGKRSIFLYKNRVKDLLYCTGTSTQHCNKLFRKSEKKESRELIPTTNVRPKLREKNWADIEGNGTPLQYSCLENPMDGGAWWAAVHGVTKSWTRLSDFTFTFHFHALEKEMATHSSVLAWRIPGTGEPGRPPSMGSHRVGHDWSDLAAAAAAIS